MMNSLYTAQSGLKTTKYAIDITSNNLANVDTEGYKKRRILSSEIGTLGGEIGRGVSFDGVNRTTNKYLYNQILTQNSISKYNFQQNTILGNAEMYFSETEGSDGSGRGLSYTLTNLFESVESYRNSPTSDVFMNDVKTQSQTLVSNLKSIYANLEDLQENSKTDLYDQVDQVNNILKQISDINEKIVVHGETNELLDKRDYLESQLSDYADIEVEDDFGNYFLKIGGEYAIFNNTNVSKLSVEEEYTQQHNIYTTPDLEDTAGAYDGQPVTLTLNNDTTVTFNLGTVSAGGDDNELKQAIADEINTNSDFSSLEAYLDTSNNLVIRSKDGGEDAAFDLKIDVAGTTITKDETISSDATDKVSLNFYGEELNLSSGSMKSLTDQLTSGTSEILSYKQSLNDFAKALVETFNSKSTTPIFTGASVKTMDYIDGSIEALTIDDLESLKDIQWDDTINIDSKSSETTSFKEFYKTLMYKVSADVEDNKNAQETQDAVLNSLEKTFQNLTKVDSDEEMVNLLKYQAAYQANAKIITAVDEMLQTILAM